MNFQITQGQVGYVDPSIAILDTGWTISGVYANHVSCNSGNIISLTPMGLAVGRTYTFTYEVSNYISGGVNIIAGTNAGTSRTANGVYSDTLAVTDIAQLSFFSDGTLTIQNLNFYDTELGQQPGITISFNEKENRWVSDYSFYPEQIITFLDQLLTIKEGSLWLHNSNPITNNFYGVQYPSQVTFIINQDYLKSKLWYNVRMDSTGGWFVSSMETTPDDQFPNGMMTQITLSNTQVIDGKRWADILRDMNDPNFSYIADQTLRMAVAMFRGRIIQGGWVIVTLQNNDTTIATLSSFETYYTEVKRGL